MSESLRVEGQGKLHIGSCRKYRGRVKYGGGGRREIGRDEGGSVRSEEDITQTVGWGGGVEHRNTGEADTRRSVGL